MQKTPEESKKALEMCQHGADCKHCPYTLLECARNQMEKDVLAYIKKLEAENAKLREKETPKACEHKATLYKDLTCPRCGNVVSQYERWGDTDVCILPEYCQFCGQHIKRPEEGGGSE